jgi:CheY-like chemotaxis protein
MPKILFVDDNKEVVEILSSILTEVGYDVIIAGDGAEAINRFDESSFDIVVTDLAMPGADGYELAKYIRASERGLRPSIICITGSTLDIDRSCFDHILEKPFSIKKFIECLRDFESKKE